MSTGERYNTIQLQAKEHLAHHLKNQQNKDLIYQKIIELSLKVLCLDRFADFQSDESNIIVRGKAAETLTKCYLRLQPKQQLTMLQKIKTLLDKEAHINGQKNFTWEVKHSFMAFFVNLT